MDLLSSVRFERSEALLLLLVLLPFAVYLSRTSMALLRPGRRRLSLGLRIALITLLVLALSGVGVVAASNRLSVVFLLDRSDSVSPDAQARESVFVRDAISRLGPDDEAGVVVFGADALVDRPVSSDKVTPDLASAPVKTYTNLANAIRLGLAMLPSDAARRLVLVSDGRQNAGDAEQAARLSEAGGVVLDTVTLASPSGPEVWIEGMDAPTQVREGERVSLQVTVQSSVDTTATLLLSIDGDAAAASQVSLSRGSNTFVQTLPPATRGFHAYSAQVVPAPGTDTRPENNRYSAFSLVTGKSRLLLVEGHSGEAVSLASALGTSAEVQTAAPGDMPTSVRDLAGYDGVVLVNVPAPSIAPVAMQSLQVAVHDLGKGLVVVGGDESYAAGGYFRTPLEAMLPVDLNLPSRIDVPSVGMVLVIDRSGSMDESHGPTGQGVKKIELAKEAAYQAVLQLSDRDYVGVVTFDYQASWAVNLQRLGDPTQLRGKIGGITAGGGTNIYAGLAPAVDALASSNAKSKHIVLLTDGVSEGGDYDALLKKMAANNITLSTVAIGSDADTHLLQSLASAGKGRYYYTEDGNALPQIFAHESHIAARSYIIERSFTPGRTSPSPITDGLGGLPKLLGYVGTSSRPGGQVVLVSDAGDPLLAQWQFGLGRVVAWTSDAQPRWAKEWVPWQDFGRFWGQAVRWSTGSEGAGALQTRITLESGAAQVTVDAALPDGTLLNNLSASAVVVAPSLVTSTIQLRQTGAGRYEGHFPTTEEGAYLLRVLAQGGETGNLAQTTGVVVPYSPEYRGPAGDDGLMARLSSITSGRALSLDDPAAALAHNLPLARSTVDLWPLLLLAAILLFPFDVGVRRVATTRHDVARAWAEMRRRLAARARPQPALAGPSSEEMAALMTARDRRREQIRQEQAEQHGLPPAPGPAEAPTAARNDRAHVLQSTPSERRETPPPDPTSGQERGVGESGEESLASRLRRSRESRR